MGCLSDSEDGVFLRRRETLPRQSALCLTATPSQVKGNLGKRNFSNNFKLKMVLYGFDSGMKLRERRNSKPIQLTIFCISFWLCVPFTIYFYCVLSQKSTQ